MIVSVCGSSVCVCVGQSLINFTGGQLLLIGDSGEHLGELCAARMLSHRVPSGRSMSFPLTIIDVAICTFLTDLVQEPGRDGRLKRQTREYCLSDAFTSLNRL